MLRPPTPNMQGQELVQWFQRVFDAIMALESAIGSLPVPLTSHDSLTENGGAGSHAQIDMHIAGHSAHGTGSDMVGVDDIQTLTNKTISALANTLSGLRHGLEVDNQPIAHGTTSTIVGVSDAQALINKVISATSNSISGLRHGVEVDEPTVAHGTTSALVGVDDPQTLTNKRIIRSVRTLMTGTMLSLTDDLIRVNDINVIVTLPVAPIGQFYTIENSAPGYCELQTIDGKLIQGELLQTIPMSSSADVVFNGYEWRFV